MLHAPSLVAATAAFLGVVAGADGVRLARSVLEGDRVQVRSEVTLEIEGADGEDHPFRARFHLRERSRETLSKVAEGRAKEVVREFVESTLDSRASVGEAEPSEESIPRPLAGRAVTIERDGDEARVTRGSESVPKALLPSIEIDHPLVRLLPDREVKEGDTWEVDAQRLAPFLRLALAGGVDPVDLEGKIECAYAGEEALEESKADAIEIEGTTKAAFGFALPGGPRIHAPVELSWKGKAWFDRRRGRFARFEATAEAEARAGSAPEGSVAAKEPEGRLRVVLQFRDAEEGDEEGTRIALRYKPGDVFTRTSTGRFEMRMDSFSLKLNGEAMDAGEEPPEFSMRATSKEETIEEILAVRDGSPTSKRIEFVTSKTVLVQETPVGDEEEESGEEVEGAVVVVTREDDEVTVKVESGDVPEDLRRALHPEDVAGFLLPSDPVERGDTWLIEPARFVQFLSGMLPVAGEDREAAEEAFQKFLSGIEGDLEGRLAGFEDGEGVPAARIALRGSLSLEPDVRDFVQLGIAISGEGPDEEEMRNLPDMDLSIEIDLRGEMLFAREEGRPVSLEMSGPVRIKFRMEQSQGEFEVETSAAFSGSIEFRLDVRRGRGR